MTSTDKSERKLLTQEFVDALQQRADTSFDGRLHQAFVAWYVAAEFGDRTHWDFTDDALDGGIDAVVWRPGETPPVVLVQSKFARRIGATQLGDKAYAELSRVVVAFRGGEESFGEWLDTVRDDLRSPYRRAFRSLADSGSWVHRKKAFRLITTQRRRARAELESIPEESCVYSDQILRLYEQHRKGTTPRARDLELRITKTLAYDDRTRGVSSYLFNAKLSDFRKYLETSLVSRLVARNIRYNLTGPVGREIRRTYEHRPHDFWYLHNGLTIICDGFKARAGRAVLSNPSVINGAQTLYAIAGSAHGSSSALVTVRVITRSDHERPVEDDEWLQRVIRAVNTQNKVKAYDFRANEPEQLELHKLFREVQVFYERKRGEWREHRNDPQCRGLSRLSLFKLGQLLMTASAADGSGVITMKRGLEEVFSEEKSYRKLFPPKAAIGRRFERIYLAYRLHRLLDSHGYASSTVARKQRHGFWNAFWLLHRAFAQTDGLHSRVKVKDIREVFDELEGTGRAAARARSAMRQITKATWAAWRKGKATDPEQWTANNFFKSPYGNKILLKLAWPAVRKAVLPIQEHLLA